MESVPALGSPHGANGPEAVGKKGIPMAWVAVFGDVRGHLRLMWKLCSYWQQAHGVHLDAILQCGDFGYFPQTGALDQATRRYAARDPEELGFANYFMSPEPLKKEDRRIREILLGASDAFGTVRAPMFWCAGNHEDFEALAAFVGERNLVSVDIYDRCRLLRSGTCAPIAGIRVGAIGGGPESHDEVDATDGNHETQGSSAVFPLPPPSCATSTRSFETGTEGGIRTRQPAGSEPAASTSWATSAQFLRLGDAFLAGDLPRRRLGQVASP
jgi:hypothetical protein